MPDDIDAAIMSSIADLPGREGEDDSEDSNQPIVEDETPVDDAPDPSADSALAPEGEVADPAVVPEPPKELSETEKLLEEEGFKKIRSDGKENRIPHSRTVKIMENRERKFAEEVTGALVPTGVRPVDAVKQYAAQIPTLQAEVQNLRNEGAVASNVLTIMENEPERYVRMLLEVHPEYAKYLRTDASANQPATVDDASMPQPDLDMGNGQLTYSVDGYAKLRAFENARIAKQVRAEIMAEVQKMPMARSYEAEQEIQRNLVGVRQQVAHAEANWKGFKENKQAIYAFITPDQRSLHEAYRLWREGSITEREAALEKQIKEAEANAIKKIKAAPTSTSAATGAKAVAVASEPESVEDIIRASIAKVKSKV